VWELKCTSKISLDHLLQVVIYAWIYKNLHPEDEKVFKILNVKTKEVMTLHASLEEITQIVIALLKGKYTPPTEKTEEEFIKEVTGEK
jgi:precorrin-4 methylase